MASGRVSSVSPSSSASRVSASLVSCSALACPVAPPPEALINAEVAVAYYQALQAYYKVVSRGTGGVTSSAVAGSTSSGRRRRRRALKARAKVVESKVEVSESSVSAAGVPGYCYLQFVYGEFRDVAAHALDANPTVMSLLSVPYRWFDLEVMAQLFVERAGPGRLHVVSAGEHSLGRVLAGLSQHCRSPGQLGLRVHEEFDGEDIGCTPDVTIGGVVTAVPSVASVVSSAFDPGYVPGANLVASPDRVGFCYLRLVRTNRRNLAVDALGEWPDLLQVLAMPEDWVDYYAWSTATLVDAGDVGYHVAFASGLPVRSVCDRRFGYPCGPVNFELIRSGARVGGSLGEWLARVSGEAEHVFDAEDLLIVSTVAANLSSDRKHRLQMFEAAGDAALTAVVASRCLRDKKTAQAYQEERSRVTGNAYLSVVYNKYYPPGVIVLPAGVTSEGRVGAKILESAVGLVLVELGLEAVDRMCHMLYI